MTTILRQSCFSLCLGLCCFFSCAEVRTKTLYSGRSGKHSRALYNAGDSFVVAGKDGVFSLFDEKFRQRTDSVSLSEDIRDAHLFDDGSIILMNSGDLGRIWKVGPDIKEQVITFDRKGCFLDGLSFWDEKNGIAYGDPVNGTFVILLTNDGGERWSMINADKIPPALPNEAGFAASGTGISTPGDSVVYIGTGMADTARIFCSYDRGNTWEVRATPIKAGDSYGIYSMFFWSENEGIIIGGSYLNPTDTEDLCFYTDNGGKSWHNRSDGLGGYTSCIHGTPDGNFLVATGRVATYYSLDKGETWSKLFNDRFYSVRVGHKRLYFSGKEGVVKVYSYQHNRAK